MDQHRKPTALRVLHGDRKDRTNDQEPVPPEGEVAPSEETSPDARAVWERLARSLIACGVLTSWGVDAFWMTCEGAGPVPPSRTPGELVGLTSGL